MDMQRSRALSSTRTEDNDRLKAKADSIQVLAWRLAASKGFFA
jgi:hypothetical protein